MRTWTNEDADSVNGMFVRVRLTSVDDSGKQQIVAAEGVLGQKIGEAVRLQNFGSTSVPPEGAEGLALASGGRFDRLHLLGLEHPDKRPTNLPGGAKAIYDAGGNIIKLIGSDGAVFGFDGHAWTVTCKGATITANGADITIDPGGHRLLLGAAPGGSFHAVSTEAGLSSKVFAAL